MEAAIFFIFYLVDSPLRPLAPPPGLVVKRTATSKTKQNIQIKVLFSLVDKSLPPLTL